MNSTTRAGTALLLALAPHAAALGPDLIVGDIAGSTSYVIGGSPKAYALSVALCDVGDAPAAFDSLSAAHPMVTANMYRLRNGRFEQIGQAWARHMSTPVEQALCATCNPSGDPSLLGAGCSTISSASAMGTQAGLGEKSEINPFTGACPFPYAAGSGSGATFKRLQVASADLTAGPLYFVSSMVVAADDSAAGNADNNESYRRVTIALVSSSSALTLQDRTERGAPAIFAWRDHGLGANMPDPSVMLTPVDVPGDGRMWVGAKVTDLGGGTWHYEYAVQNLTSDRAAGSFAIPVPAQAFVTNAAFHGVAYHSGEVYDNADWGVTISADAVAWKSPQTFAQNPDTNALRWDTLYNFRFDCNFPPVHGVLGIGLFKPGTPDSVSAASLIPIAPCVADLDDGSGTGTPDGGVTIDDLLFFLFLFSVGDSRADLDDGSGTGTHDGGVTIDDLLYFIAHFAAGC